MSKTLAFSYNEGEKAVYMHNVIKKLSSSFEMLCALSILALIGDLSWLIHDILNNGLTLWYLMIGTSFIVGILGTSVLWYRHFTGREKKEITSKKIIKLQSNDWGDRLDIGSRR